MSKRAAKILYLGLVLFIACAGKTPQKETKKITMEELNQGDQLTILFYNVENLFDTLDNPLTEDDDFTPNSYKKWDTDRYFQKQANLAKVIKASGDDLPLFMGLAEVENKRVVQDLINTRDLKKGNYGIVHEESPDERGIDVAFLYQKEYFEVENHKPITITFSFNYSITTRDILYVKGKLANGERLHFFVNHWSSRREGKEETEPKRLEAAHRLREEVNMILDKDKDAKIIIMGDFNDYPDDKSIVEVLQATDKWPQPEGGLVNLVAEREAIGDGTHNYRGDWGFLDQMIVTPSLINSEEGLTTSLEGVRAVKEDWMLYHHKKFDEYKPSKTYGGPKYYGGYSDHLPLLMKLFIK